MSTIPFPEFTEAARKRWDRIPRWACLEIIECVWCGKCSDGVPMQLLSGSIEDNCLVLRGTCKQCGSEVARAIEPDEL